MTDDFDDTFCDFCETHASISIGDQYYCKKCLVDYLKRIIAESMEKQEKAETYKKLNSLLNQNAELTKVSNDRVMADASNIIADLMIRLDNKT